jgi:hypothetical protein
VVSHHRKGYGLGKMADAWYAKGIPSTTPKETDAVIS